MYVNVFSLVLINTGLLVLVIKLNSYLLKLSSCFVYGDGSTAPSLTYLLSLHHTEAVVPWQLKV